MLEGITTPKWCEFQRSLARILKVTIGVIDSGGNLAAVYNELSPFFELRRSSSLSAAYHEFFLEVARMGGEVGRARVVRDPLGLLVAVIPLGGPFLIMGGGSDKSKSNCRADFQRRLQQHEVPESEDMWTRIPSLSIKELQEKVANVETLYVQLSRSFTENTKLGQRMMLLAALEEINKLMVGLLGPEHFDLHKILDLVVSSLIILFDAEGAWVFTHRRRYQATTVHRGGCSELLQGLQRNWEDKVSRREDPVDAASAWGEPGKVADDEYKIETTYFRKKESGASLGVISPENEHVRTALSAFAKQVAIAVEMASLYEEIQRQVGTVLNSIRQGMIITNRQGQTMVVNQAASEILRLQEISLPLGQAIAGRGLGKSVEMAISGAALDGETYFQKHSTLGEGAGEIYLRWDIVPFLREDGAIIGSILMFEDVTENVKLRRQRQDWERLAAAGEVAAGLAHEIRNPLAAALGAVQLFAMVDDETKRKEIMHKLSDELHRMNGILTDFLVFAKPGEREMLERTDLNQVIRDMSFILKNQARINDIELIYCPVPEDFPLVLAEANALKQVFLNIAKNALEAMPGGGRLEVSMCRDNDSVRVAFKDTGQGIPQENLANIFRPFFTTKLGGTGLGLSISSSIVQRMGGEMKVGSSLGSGTSVEVILPVYREGANSE